jgi:hypothetical protein
VDLHGVTEIQVKLLHYSTEPIQGLRPVSYLQRPEMQPSGLWLSVGQAWKDWCLDNLSRPEELQACHHVTLQPGADILKIKTPQDIDWLTAEFHVKCAFPTIATYYLDWPSIARRWQGIIIAPYQYSRRLNSKTAWYYPWDCASGCIWDLDAIRSIELVTEKCHA